MAKGTEVDGAAAVMLVEPYDDGPSRARVHLCEKRKPPSDVRRMGAFLSFTSEMGALFPADPERRRTARQLSPRPCNR